MADQSLSPVSTVASDSVKVMIVDDSAFMRFAIAQQLNEYPGIVVVGTASNGREALTLIPKLQPDVITLDVEMPHMDGLTTLRHIMTDFPRPVIMFSSLTKEGAAETVQALMLGAVDFIPKPANRTDIREVMKDMTSKIMHAARAKVKYVPLRPVVSLRSAYENNSGKGLSTYHKTTPIVLIGASTGGPGALSEVIPLLPEDFPCPVLIVQHMPAGFTHSLSERLNSISQLNVKEAEPGDALLVGQVLLAPGGFHMTIDENERIALNQKPTVHGVRPAVDVTLLSLVQRYGNNIIAVIMTGMGSDGTHGASLLHSEGGYVIAEDESTCVVWGMPRSVVEAGAADAVHPRTQIVSAVESAIRKLKSQPSSVRTHR
jgi:two-component system, chemotaxis family, protein-glutamate methylesterase/glutaminase